MVSLINSMQISLYESQTFPHYFYHLFQVQVIMNLLILLHSIIYYYVTLQLIKLQMQMQMYSSSSQIQRCDKIINEIQQKQKYCKILSEQKDWYYKQRKKRQMRIKFLKQGKNKIVSSISEDNTISKQKNDSTISEQEKIIKQNQITANEDKIQKLKAQEQKLINQLNICRQNISRLKKQLVNHLRNYKSQYFQLKNQQMDNKQKLSQYSINGLRQTLLKLQQKLPGQKFLLKEIGLNLQNLKKKHAKLEEQFCQSKKQILLLQKQKQNQKEYSSLIISSKASKNVVDLKKEGQNQMHEKQQLKNQSKNREDLAEMSERLLEEKENLQQQKLHLIQQVQTFSASILEVSKKAETISLQQNTVKRQIKAISRQIQAQQLTLQLNEAQLNQIGHYIDRKKEQLCLVTTQIHNLQMEVCNCEKKLKMLKLSKEYPQSQQILQRQKQNVQKKQRLKEKINILKISLRSTQQEICKLLEQAKLKQLEGQKKQFVSNNEELSKLRLQLQELSSQIKNIQAKIKQSNNRKDLGKQKITKLKKERSQQQQVLNELEIKQEKIGIQISIVYKQLDKNEIKLKELQQEQNKYRDQRMLDVYQDKNNEAMFQISEYQEVQEQISKLIKDKMTLIQGFNVQICEYILKIKQKDLKEYNYELNRTKNIKQKEEAFQKECSMRIQKISAQIEESQTNMQMYENRVLNNNNEYHALPQNQYSRNEERSMNYS